MQLIFIAVIILLIIIAFIYLYSKNPEDNHSKNGILPYIKKEILTKNEQMFFTSLAKAICSEFLIFPKVRLWDIIDAKKELPKKEKLKYQNKIKQKHIDFILISPHDYSVVLAIELDDTSHNKPQVIKNDLFKNQALKNAGIPLVRLQTQKNYSTEKIKQIISDLIKPLQKTTQTPQK